MRVIINGKIFNFVQFNNEFAFHITDALLILDCYCDLSVIVLGGDILTNELNYSYDNWYYNIDNNLSNEENSKNSITVAKTYLKKYIDRNGTDYYCVFVPKQKGWFTIFE